jgi:hypothetical protein
MNIACSAVEGLNGYTRGRGTPARLDALPASVPARVKRGLSFGANMCHFLLQNVHGQALAIS